MNDLGDLVTPGVIVTALGGVAVAIGQLGKLWATIRREEITSVAESARLTREAQERRDERELNAMDRIAAEVRDHTTKDLAHHSLVLQAIARVDAKQDARREPSERRRKTQTPGHGAT